MDIALEVVSVQATAPGTTASSFTAVSGDSLQVRDAKGAKLVSMWGTRQSPGNFRITSPLIHDAVVGLGHQINSGSAQLHRLGVPQKLTPQDNLVATGTGSSTAGDIESNSLLLAYEDLAGICGKFITFETLVQQGEELYDSENTLSLGTSGGYSGSELLNSEEDQLKANMDYAIVGLTLGGNVSTLNTVGWTSPDWGNLRVGMPARTSQSRWTSDYFASLSRWMGMPLIPVFNASQKNSVFIDGLGSEDGGSPVIKTHMVRLKKGTVFGRGRK